MINASIAQLKDWLAAGELSANDLAAAFERRIETIDPELNSLISRVEANAPASTDGPLAGIPYAHKDIFCAKGTRTTCGSRMLGDWVAPYDSTVHERLSQSGAVLLGKANMDEFAMGSSNENSHFGAVANPWDTAAVPGGSSGGSAAAVAARLVPFATGTDTGGSIRQPAAFCGVTGIKPTYGRVSRYGMIAYASSFDQGGVIAKSAADCALVLGEMAGFDPKDSTSSDEAVPDYVAGLDGSIEGLRVGIPKQWFSDALDPAVGDAVTAAIDELRAAGARMVEIDLPDADIALAAYYLLAPAEASSNLSRFDGVRFGYRCEDPKDLQDLYERTRSEGFGSEVKRRILVGTYALSAGYYDAFYRRAQKARRLVTEHFQRAFDQCDLIAGPVTPTPAFDRGAHSDDPAKMYLEDIFTIPVNLAGLPGMSVPAGFVNGRPVGLQLIGRHFDEGRLLNVAHQYQQRVDWHERMPSIAGDSANDNREG
ncbi:MULTISPECIES: Asp-tRNA(Asn)/Glu-tRNA(Gln) amidotransferase subunit GatA [unclassified Guyparkeria]|uniref:Asp-tRNA(Asn)/Glu-tRNA(Gln) amidotransferase subunit GatA n=1 Tax=unclassified Guyparkeria TaxID=2626246 RepID=UPI0007339FFD|nr:MULTISPECIES: Asp-tRNA(Asn)/Glu-tRNA(Gln) amidotransferase subunit GatA [unclassified Guyparkeria]KTG17960.1 glutamyl-tRNA amidotransferase [Guyparkeria sp. XI15]OAE89669.1 glutamyl-tRNA amidotransferase [Guyparkeria sp. WRN-7]